MRRLLIALLLLLPGAARAQHLTIGVQADLPSLDPHVAPAQTSEATLRHIYDALVARDPELRIGPGLATSWRMVEPTVWEFTLRQGVRFSDGTPLRAEDVKFSIERARTVKYTSGTYAPYVRAVKAVTIPAPGVVRIETFSPYLQLLGDLCRIAIVPEAVAGHAATEDFNRLSAAVGSGPYRATAWQPGAPLRMERNPNYWGEAPAWEEVSIQPVAGDAARLAGLLSGSLDLIDKVPMADVAKLRANPAFGVFVHDGNRSMFLAPNFTAKAGAYVAGPDGEHLATNPLMDMRVRRAVSLAINRPAIVARVMEGLGSAANQVVPPGMFGFDPALPEALYDIEGARRLLAEAGYKKGFRLTLHCSNGRYVNDQMFCQAAAQMLTRAGIRTEVQAEPQSVFYARLGKQDFDLVLNGWGSDTGDSIIVLRQALHSPDPAKGLGGFNRGSWHDAEADSLIEQAMGTADPEAREKLQRQAMDRAMDQVAVIPLYTSAWIWAARRGVIFQGGFEEGTLAMRARPAP